MIETHVVVGAGPVGTAVARQLAEAGHEVRVVTRSGSGPDHPGVVRVRADASDAGRLAEVSAGATAVYNCVNPAYHRWPVDWPPVAASLLAAAERHGAVLATVSNLYPYGPVTGPMREDTPEQAVDTKGRVRARMWADARAAHEAGRVRAVEVRASDYSDAGANSHLARNAAAVLAAKRAWVMGDADQPHTWTSTRDTARLLVAAAADPTAHGRTWHVPSPPPRTQREALTDLARVAGAPAPRVGVVRPWLLRAVSPVADGAGARRHRLPVHGTVPARRLLRPDALRDYSPGVGGGAARGGRRHPRRSPRRQPLRFPVSARRLPLSRAGAPATCRPSAARAGGLGLRSATPRPASARGGPPGTG